MSILNHISSLLSVVSGRIAIKTTCGNPTIVPTPDEQPWGQLDIFSPESFLQLQLEPFEPIQSSKKRKAIYLLA